MKPASGWVYLADCQLFPLNDSRSFDAVKYGCTSLDPNKRLKRLKYEKRETHEFNGLLAYAFVPNRYWMENQLKWEMLPGGRSAMDESLVTEPGEENSKQNLIERFYQVIFERYGITATVTDLGRGYLNEVD